MILIFMARREYSKLIWNVKMFSYLFSGMKVYVTDEKELIMEPSLKWAGNPNVAVVARAFGLKATVQVICF